MKCEFCSNDKYDEVRHYESPMIKHQACIKCCRKVDEMISELDIKYKKELRNKIKEMME